MQVSAKTKRRQEPIRSLIADRLNCAKRAFTTRRVDLADAYRLGRLSGAKVKPPKPGDLVLASVVRIGLHTRLEDLHGRKSNLYPGDEIIVAYGERYAPDQFEAVVPDNFSDCELVAGGGVAAKVVSKHARVKHATSIKPIGPLLRANGQPLNVADYALEAPRTRPPERTLIAVVGTSMNAGKTTMAAHLIRGLTNAGVRVGACKVTGTGSGGDVWAMRDAGAVQAIDFTDAGFATTAGIDPAIIDKTAMKLIALLEADPQVDVVVAEVADGLLQRETAALLSPPSAFASRIDTLLLAAADAMGAISGADWLLRRGLPLRAVSGLLTASPLAAREGAANIKVEIAPTFDLMDPVRAASLCLQAGSRQILALA